MTNHPESPPACDVHLLLRAHAYQRWLSRELMPFVRELEQPHSLPDEQLGVALAYLEVLWIEASRRAAETEAASAQLDAASAQLDAASSEMDATARHSGRALCGMIRRYHEAVRALHNRLASHVAELLGGSSRGSSTNR